MPTIIPLVPSDARYEFTTDLEGSVYLFRARWNTRDAACYLDIFEENGTAIVLGVKIVLGVALAHYVAHPLFANGVLVARDLSRSGREATLDDIGDRVQVWYLTRDEMIAEMLGTGEREDS